MTMIEPSMSPLSEWRRPRPVLDGRSMLTHLFNRLDGAYPGRFAGLFKNQQAIDNWMDAWEEGLLRENIQPAEAREALQRLPAGWPPGLPDFLALCRPPMDPEAAFHEAIAGLLARRRGELGEWSHPAIYWAAVRVTEHDMVANGYQVVRTRWAAALKDWLAKGRWPEIPMPAIALPRPGATETSSADGLRRIAELGSNDIARKSPKGREIAWAAQILERDRSGRNRPPMGCVAMARRALGVLDDGGSDA